MKNEQLYILHHEYNRLKKYVISMYLRIHELKGYLTNYIINDDDYYNPNKYYHEIKYYSSELSYYRKEIKITEEKIKRIKKSIKNQNRNYNGK